MAFRRIVTPAMMFVDIQAVNRAECRTARAAERRMNNHHRVLQGDERVHAVHLHALDSLLESAMRVFETTSLSFLPQIFRFSNLNIRKTRMLVANCVLNLLLHIVSF